MGGSWNSGMHDVLLGLWLEGIRVEAFRLSESLFDRLAASGQKWYEMAQGNARERFALAKFHFGPVEFAREPKSTRSESIYFRAASILRSVDESAGGRSSRRIHPLEGCRCLSSN
jgi:hypothetical protein